MRLTKEYILRRVNRLLITFKVTWEDLVDELDMGIEEINKYLSTKYPMVSEVLDKHASPDKTYSYRAGGKDHPFFPVKYFNSIVIPFAAMQLLTIEEEFSEIYSKYANEWQENLFVMARDEMNNIPYHFIQAPQGVYFANPNPEFKQNPEHYFNKKIKMDLPKLKIEYSWGNFYRDLPKGVEAFVDKQLPVDNNFYEPGEKIKPVSMSGQNFTTYLVDYHGTVLGVFSGWSYIDSGNKDDIISPETVIEFKSNDIKLYAVFDTDVIGITYKGNGGTLLNWKPQYIGSEFLNKYVFPYGGQATRRGFEFLGFWPKSIFVNQSLINHELGLDNPYWLEAAQDIGPEDNLIFKAKWEREEYKIEYLHTTYNGTDYGKNLEPSKYFYGQDIMLPVIQEDAFIGWWDNNLFKGDPIFKIASGEIENKKFYAKFNNERFRVTWLNNQIPNQDFTAIEEMYPFNYIINDVKTEIANIINNKIELEQLPLGFNITPDFVIEETNGIFYKYNFGPKSYWAITSGTQKTNINNELKVVRTTILAPVYIERISQKVNITFISVDSLNNELKRDIIQVDKGMPYNEEELKKHLDSNIEDKFLNRIISNHYEDRILQDIEIIVLYTANNITINLYALKKVISETITVELKEELNNKLTWTGSVEPFNLENITNSLDWNQEYTSENYAFKESLLAELFEVMTLKINTESISVLEIGYNTETNFLNSNLISVFGNIPQTETLNNETLSYKGLKYLVTDFVVPIQIEIDPDNIETISVYPYYDFSEEEEQEEAIYTLVVKGQEHHFPKANAPHQINLKNFRNGLPEESDSRYIFENYFLNGNKLSSNILTLSENDIKTSTTNHLEFQYSYILPSSINLEVEVVSDVNQSYYDNYFQNKVIESYKNYYKDLIENKLRQKFYNLTISPNDKNRNITFFTEEELLQTITTNQSVYQNEKRDEFTIGTELNNFSINGEPQTHGPISYFVKTKEGDINLKISLSLGNDVEGYSWLYVKDKFIDYKNDIKYHSDENYDYKKSFMMIKNGTNIYSYNIINKDSIYLSPTNKEIGALYASTIVERRGSIKEFNLIIEQIFSYELQRYSITARHTSNQNINIETTIYLSGSFGRQQIEESIVQIINNTAKEIYVKQTNIAPSAMEITSEEAFITEEGNRYILKPVV